MGRRTWLADAVLVADAPRTAYAIEELEESSSRGLHVSGIPRLLENCRERIPGDAKKLLPWLISQSQGSLLELLALCTALSVSTIIGREGYATSS